VPKLSQERWQRVEPILDRALELPPEEWSAFLDEACGDDAELRADAETLLQTERTAPRFLEAPAASFLLEATQAMPAPKSSHIGALIGPYRIVRELGRGGMGTVYLAERADGQFDQRVALKLIRGGAASDDLVRRFLHERQILARLEHPNVARLLDGGLTPDGQPYFAMEFIDGEPITTYCTRNGLTIEERLRLFRAAADAVAYAHRNLVVHRDLKPSNVLVTRDGQVKLLDFGIAKLLEDSEEGPTLTRSGLYLLTPEYAAPEQVRGSTITTATDVYTLGAVLYELLSGQRAHRFDTHTPAELARVICEQEPVPPSTAVTSAKADTTASGITMSTADRAQAEPRRLRRRLHGDLDNIVMKALRKEPERRYASVDALLEDIARYESGLPVKARRDSVGYRGSKFVRRNRAAVAAAVVVALSLVGGIASSQRQARVAALESAKAEQVKNFVLDLFAFADPDFQNGAEITARQLLERGDQRVDEELADQPALQAEMLAILGSIDRKLGLYDEAAVQFERALEIERRLNGPRHANVAARLHDLGDTEVDRSRLVQAESLHREALAIRRELFDERAPLVARSLSSLAAALNAAGRYDEAERLQREALTIDRSQPGPDDVRVAEDLEVLATILHDKGDFAGAATVGEETLALRRQLQGPEHLETATAMNNLAGYLRRRGDLDAADSLYRDVHAFDLRRLGEDHPNTATVRNNLAGVLHEKGDYAEAERLYRDVLAFDLEHFGEEHRYTALVMGNLAAVLRDQGELAESEQYARQSYDLFRRSLGETHPVVGFTGALLAGVLLDRGDLDAAEPVFRQSLALLDSTVGRAHPRSATGWVGYGRLLTARGRPHEAEPVQRAALDALAASYREDDARIAEARRALGETLVAQRRFDEAEPILMASFDALRGRTGQQVQRARTARSLVALYQAWNRPERAEAFRLVEGH
jgi:eukaryotic-like serine/threonine-protein kinase